MLINKIKAINFRALTSINLKSDRSINVIVGPNAMGKSTILEAIRLAKCILIPRTPIEAQQALIHAGLSSPHQQSIGGPTIDINSLANVNTAPVEIGFEVCLNDDEIMILKSEIGSLSLLHMQSNIGASNLDNPFALTQFLSTQTGKNALAKSTEEANRSVSELKSGSTLTIEMNLSPVLRTITGANAMHQSMLAILDRRLPIHQTFFSLFPADRSFPSGEQVLQIGSGDAQAQLLSHMAQPSTKYARLKQVILQSIMLKSASLESVEAEFNLIFNELLPGKKLSGVNVNDLGLLKVLVEDEARGKIFDIDHMSSGEKGLVLTFLFIRLNMAKGGVILLDEPELHLNSAVQTKILPFLIDHCIKPLNLQAFICTHSPEIVRDAYERDDCNLFHLRGGDDLTPIRRQDLEPLFEVFGRLGSSAADVLFNKGSIFLEGDHDVIIVQAGFQNDISGYKVTSLGGRGDIERDVPLLQAEERAGRLHRRQLFILDSDRKPTKLTSTSTVRVRQLKRYCIENYLLDEEIMYDIISAHAKGEVETLGRFPEIVREIALKQTRELALKEAYESVVPDNPGLRISDTRDRSISESVRILADRLDNIRASLEGFDKPAWIDNLVSDVQRREAAMRSEWSGIWKERCSGKRLIDDLYVRYEIAMKKSEYKKEIMKRMADKQTDDWQTLRRLIVGELEAS